MLKIALWHQDASINIELGATVAINENEECLIGYFKTSCGGLAFISSEKEKGPSSVISIDKLGKYPYLFFARLVPSDVSIKNIIFNPGLTLSSEQ